MEQTIVDTSLGIWIGAGATLLGGAVGAVLGARFAAGYAKRMSDAAEKSAALLQLRDAIFMLDQQRTELLNFQANVLADHKDKPDREWWVPMTRTTGIEDLRQSVSPLRFINTVADVKLAYDLHTIDRQFQFLFWFERLRREELEANVSRWDAGDQRPFHERRKSAASEADAKTIKAYTDNLYEMVPDLTERMRILIIQLARYGIKNYPGEQFAAAAFLHEHYGNLQPVPGEFRLRDPI